MNSGEERRPAMEPLIIFIPRKSMPRPVIILPTCFIFSFFANIIKAAPINTNSGATSPIPTASRTPFIVAPILAPIIMPTVCERVIRPEFTKPTSITVVADDDWISAVIKVPIITPLNVVEVNFSISLFIFSPAAASRPLLIRFIPNKNIPRPPRRPNKSDIVITASFLTTKNMIKKYLFTF